MIYKLRDTQTAFRSESAVVIDPDLLIVRRLEVSLYEVREIFMPCIYLVLWAKIWESGLIRVGGWCVCLCAAPQTWGITWWSYRSTYCRHCAKNRVTFPAELRFPPMLSACHTYSSRGATGQGKWATHDAFIGPGLDGMEAE